MNAVRRSFWGADDGGRRMCPRVTPQPRRHRTRVRHLPSVPRPRARATDPSSEMVPYKAQRPPGGGRGRMSPFSETPTPPDGGGGGALLSGHDGGRRCAWDRHGDRNPKKKCKWHFWNQRVDGGSEKWSPALFSMKVNCRCLCQKTAKTQAPDTRAPSPPPPPRDAGG